MTKPAPGEDLAKGTVVYLREKKKRRYRDFPNEKNAFLPFLCLSTLAGMSSLTKPTFCPCYKLCNKEAKCARHDFLYIRG
jgi:hypothetical protein